MKTTINREKDLKAKDMAPILGITERSVTYRLKSIMKKVRKLNYDVSVHLMTSSEAETIISKLINERLAGYNYEVTGTEERPQYTFYKNF